MPSRCLWLVPLLAWGCLLAGCSTTPEKAGSGRSNSANSASAATSPVSIPRDPPEKVERRANAHAHFLNALTLELNNDTEGAEQEYEKALELDPSNEGLAIDLSRRYIQQKKFERAAEVLKKAAESPESSAMVQARLGIIYLQLGRTNDAIAANQSAIKRQPDSIAGYQSLYTLYFQLGRTNDARRVLEQAGKRRDVDAPFLIDLAGMYLVEDSQKTRGTNAIISGRAREALNKAAALNPTNIVVLHKMAQTFRILGETERASAIYQQLVKDHPHLPGLREELTELLLRSRDTKGAAEQLQELVRENPTNPQAYVYLGAIAYDERRYEEAVEHYRKALLLNPNLEQIYYDIAGAKIALDDAREALDWLRQAEKRFKQSFIGEFFKAISYVRLKEFTNAIDHFTAAEVLGRATDTNRLTHTFYFQFASAHERAGQIEEAERLFEKTLRMSPDFAEALNYLGYMWAERGTNLDRAHALIEKAVQLSPTNSAYLDSLAWVLFKQGKPREALPHMEKAIELSEEPDATLFDHLGDIRAALKDTEKAREAWRKAVEMEPNPAIEKKLNDTGQKPDK